MTAEDKNLLACHIKGFAIDHREVHQGDAGDLKANRREFYRTTDSVVPVCSQSLCPDGTGKPNRTLPSHRAREGPADIPAPLQPQPRARAFRESHRPWRSNIGGPVPFLGTPSSPVAIAECKNTGRMR